MAAGVALTCGAALGRDGDVVLWLVSHAVTTIAVWSLISLGLSTVDRAFAEVIRQERELTETIDRAPDGILITDSDDIVRVANPAALRLLRCDRDACIGRSIVLVLQPADVSGGSPEDAPGEVAGLHLETDFIAKPFSSDALAQRVSAKLASRRNGHAFH